MSESRKSSTASSGRKISIKTTDTTDKVEPERKISRKTSKSGKENVESRKTSRKESSAVKKKASTADGDAERKSSSARKTSTKNAGGAPETPPKPRKPSVMGKPTVPPIKELRMGEDTEAATTPEPESQSEAPVSEAPASEARTVTPPPAAPVTAKSPTPASKEMEARVKSPPSGGVKKVGKWTIDQLRQTDGIIPLQYGTNKFDSQKNWYAHSGRGTPRNNTTNIKDNVLPPVPEDMARLTHSEVRLQSGSNKFCSQKGMVGMGSPRDVVRESHPVEAADLVELPEEKVLASQGIVRLQSGTNKYESQKGMTLIGTNRREVTHMKDSKNPDFDIETSIDQSTIPTQMGTNKYDSQKGMTSLGTNRRELTKMKDTKHPEQSVEHPDQSTVGGQMGSNKYDSQRGMTGFGQPRWETLNPKDPRLGKPSREGNDLVRFQMGSNIYASQKMMTGFGMPRDVKKGMEAEGQELPFEAIMESEKIIIKQAGWNKGDSQKNMTKFGTPRDVRGRHIQRIWELEFPEECIPHNVL